MCLKQNMYEINQRLGPAYISRVYVNESLFNLYISFNNETLFKFFLLVCRRVQRRFQSQTMPYFIHIQGDTLGSQFYSPLSPIFDSALSNYNFAPHMDMYVRGPNYFDLRITVNRARQNEYGTGTILFMYAFREFPIGTDQVFRFFSEAVEFILALKANTIPIMKTISELATFRGLPPNPDFDFNKKPRFDEALTNEEKLDALQIFAQNQSEFVRLNANDLPIDMLRKIKNNM